MYIHKDIEKKWQNYWEENKTFKVKNDFTKPKYYTLDMFPFPSGAGLHVGHPEGMTANDIIARYKTTKGYNVLHPMGWDAFGLPAENYAIKTGTHPSVTTKQNIDNFRKQIKALGFSYDWDREVNTTDPKYYKWTQWIFLKLFEKGLAYEQDLPINYCPSCKTGLANEEVLNDFTCERCGTKVEKKQIRQWVLAITKYADRLLKDVDKLDWPEGIKEMQRNWIGKSEGCEFEMKKYIDKGTGTSKDNKEKEVPVPSIRVYTTRIDTVFGMTYAVLAPDHKSVNNFITPEQKEICEKYIEEAGKKSDQDRTQDDKEKTGVFTGSYVINPFNGKEVPLWIGDYVLGNYGTGAVMAVPAHDTRDFTFAKKYNLKIIPSIGTNIKLHKDIDNGIKYNTHNVGKNGDTYFSYKNKVFTDLGILVNSGKFDGLDSKTAQEKLIEYAEKKGFGTKKINYKLRDWLFSRQRYWGEPIPLIHLKDESLKKLDIKKENSSSQNEVGPQLDSAKFSCKYSILEKVEKVKGKKKKNNLISIKGEIKIEKGNITFNGRKIFKHFRNKTDKERKFRIIFGQIIFENIHKIIFIDELVGYISINKKIFRIILNKIGEKKYEVKTYYKTENFTKIFNKAYIKTKKDGDYLMIRGQEFSKIYDGIYGKIVCDYSLPLELPEVEDFAPAGDGQSPLAKVNNFVNIKLAENLTGKRETNTMPQWGGSCWYYLRYMDPTNLDKLVDPEVEKYWGQVDSYVGGAEHAVLHLLYARFWHKFLFDIGVVSHDEPFHRLRNQGLILAHAFQRKNGGLLANDLVEEKDGQGELSGKDKREHPGVKFYEIETGEEVDRIVSKMSKSLKNVVNPDDIVEEYGADSLRLYEMYLADFKDAAPWDTTGIVGVRRFLEKSERLFGAEAKISSEDDNFTMKLVHKTIKKIESDIENYKFNTAIASLMILVNNGLPKDENLQKEWKNIFVRILHPFAPHLAEELWERLGEKESVFKSTWPEYDEKMTIDNTIKIAVQVLGKVRGTIEINKDEDKDSVLEKARNNPDVAKWLEGKNLVKEIYVPGKIVNLVVI